MFSFLANAVCLFLAFLQLKSLGKGDDNYLHYFAIDDYKKNRNIVQKLHPNFVAVQVFLVCNRSVP
jgi:hypothetical protein